MSKIICSAASICVYRVGAYAVQYLGIYSEIQLDIKMKKLAQLEPHFSNRKGAWHPISRASANPGLPSVHL